MVEKKKSYHFLEDQVVVAWIGAIAQLDREIAQLTQMLDKANAEEFIQHLRAKQLQREELSDEVKSRIKRKKKAARAAERETFARESFRADGESYTPTKDPVWRSLQTEWGREMKNMVRPGVIMSESLKRIDELNAAMMLREASMRD